MIDRHPIMERSGKGMDAQDSMIERQQGIGWNDVNMSRRDCGRLHDALHGNGGMPGEQLRKERFVLGIQMLQQDERETAFHRHLREKLLEYFQAAGRSPYR